jgi:16S rRNA (cytosine1402-N4)-methyltransferase
MLKECIEGLQIQPDGTYVDVTFGGGGHSLAILQELKAGKLFAFDQDADAKLNADGMRHPGFLFIQGNFRDIKRYLKFYKTTQVDGILADLGVSSHQFDQAERGFSTRFDADLDMRMDRNTKLTARTVLNTYSEQDLHKIFGMFGEVKNAKTLAAAIVSAREHKPFKKISELKAVLDPLAKKGREFKYYAQVFQALRIVVNDEMVALEEMLSAAVDLLKPGGRLVVMSYHSLEDRLVKNLIKTGNFAGKLEKDFYGNVLRPLKEVNRKPITASEEELKINNRARSAKLRIAEKL